MACLTGVLRAKCVTNMAQEPMTVSESHVEGFPMTAGMLKMTYYAIIRIAQHLSGTAKDGFWATKLKFRHSN